jgi:hypothetical protein
MGVGLGLSVQVQGDLSFADRLPLAVDHAAADSGRTRCTRRARDHGNQNQQSQESQQDQLPGTVAMDFHLALSLGQA